MTGHHHAGSAVELPAGAANSKVTSSN